MPTASPGDPSSRPDAETATVAAHVVPVGSTGPPAVPGYEILEELGRGGMGVVYRARQTGLNRLVALKMALAGARTDPRDLIRFLAEAEAIGAIDHPHVVKVYDFGQNGGRPYMALEFVDGDTLARHVRGQGTLPPNVAAGLVEKVARGVQAAHALGIVHRDLKPGNVLLDAAGEPKVTDFGLAKRGAGADLTQTGAMLGTPQYMAPEQAAGEGKYVGPAADVYALGVILYECLAGRPPFRASDHVTLILKVAVEDAPSVRSVAPGVPRDLALICHKCLEKQPADRYPSAGALADDLRRWQEGRPITARPVPAWELVWRAARRNKLAAGLTAGFLLALVLGLIGTLTFAVRASRNAAAADESAAQAAIDRDKATAAARESLEGLVRVNLAQGTTAVETGDLATGLLWYHKAWQIAREARLPEANHRTRMAGVIGRLPRLEACLVLPNPVLDAIWLPSGRWAAVRTTTGVHVWEPGAADEEGRPLPLPAAAAHLAVGPGDRLAVCCRDGSVRLFDPATGTPIGPPLAHPAAVTWAAFHPTEPTLATACDDGKVRQWRLPDGTPAGNPIEFAKVSFVTYDPAGGRLLVASEENKAAVFDAAGGTVVLPAVPHIRRQARLRGELVGYSIEPAFRADGAAVAGFDDAGAWVRPTTGGAELFRRKSTRTHLGKRVGFLPDGRLLVQSGDAVFLSGPGRADQALVHPRESMFASLSPDGKRLASASTGGKLHLWDIASRDEVIQPVYQIGDITAVRFAPDGRTVLAAGTDGTVRVWRPDNPTLAGTPLTPPHPDADQLARVSDDETRLTRVNRDNTLRVSATRGEGGQARVTDRATGAELFTADALGPLESARFTPDGRVLIVLGEKGVSLWDVPARRCVVRDAKLAGQFVTAVAAPAADRALVVTRDQFAVFDLKTGATVFGPASQIGDDAPGATGPATTTGYGLTRGDISPDGKTVVMPGGAYRVVRLYDLDTGQVRPVTIQDGATYRAAFTPDGSKVLTCASDGSARAWNPRTLAPVGPPLWHPNFVRDAVWRPDGRTVATLASDDRVRVWDALTGELLLPPLPTQELGGGGRVFWSADGARLAAYSQTGPKPLGWTVPTLGLTADQTAVVVELLTGRRIDPTGGLVPVREDEVRTAVGKYRAAVRAYRAVSSAR